MALRDDGVPEPPKIRSEPATRPVGAAIGPRSGVGQAEQVGAAADQVVLALVAEQDVVAAAALDVVLAVAVLRFDGRLSNDA